MKLYTGYQWLLIDAASQYGLDKLTFEKRIEWAERNINNLESEIPNADEKTRPLYQKAILAIRKAQQGLPTGHLVSVDASCSGIQIMSSCTGCCDGARATGLVDPDRRADAYTDTTDEMNYVLGGKVAVDRKDAKKAVMTSFYASKATPRAIFGEATAELKAFYMAIQKVAPGAWDLLQVLLNSWNPWALQHAWKLPDGFDAVVKVMVKKEARIEVQELGGASFTYVFTENEGTEKGLSNVANVVHSMDAYVLREMHRRCNYDKDQVNQALITVGIELDLRKNGKQQTNRITKSKIEYYIEQYERSTLASSVIIPYLNTESVSRMSVEHLMMLKTMMEGMLQYKPFPLVTVH